MPRLREVLQDTEEMARSIKARGSSADLDQIIRLESAHRNLMKEQEELQAATNSAAREWKIKQRDASGEEKAEFAQVAAERKRKLQEITEQVREAKEVLDSAARWLPNYLDPRVPVGTEDDNRVLRTFGTPRKFDFEPLPHEVLGERLGMIDIPRGVKVAGTRFVVFAGDGVLLRQAVQRLFFDLVVPQGFVPVHPPLLARQDTLRASGYLPFGREDNFNLADEPLSLIGTSEQPIVGMHADEVLTDLPRLYVGESLCFRKESGSAGRDTRGAIRVHQFYKVEQMVICAPEDSEEWHLRCQKNEEWLVQALEIPYQTMLLASGDLGAPARIKYDCEGWFPAQNKYRELTSNSNLGDFQTERGNIRYVTEDGKKAFPHTISATGFTDRLVLAIMENYQQADGTIDVPKVLIPYLDGKTKLGSPEVRKTAAAQSVIESTLEWDGIFEVEPLAGQASDSV